MNRALILTAIAALVSTGASRAERGDLLAASAERDTAQVRLLLKHGADVDTTDVAGNTALMVAAAYGYGDVAAILVEAGADVDARGRIGNTALIYAAQSGSDEVARILVEGGADLAVANEFGNTARGLAAGYGFRDIVELIDGTPTRVAASEPVLAF